MSDEERRAWLKQAVINDARQLLGRHPELRAIESSARDMFAALVDAKTWHLNKGPEPTKDWKEPDEIWSLKPNVTRR